MLIGIRDARLKKVAFLPTLSWLHFVAGVQYSNIIRYFLESSSASRIAIYRITDHGIPDNNLGSFADRYPIKITVHHSAGLHRYRTGLAV